MEKQDRRRKYPEGEKLVRFTISMSETQYKEILEAAGDSSVSKYIREALNNYSAKLRKSEGKQSA